MITHQILNAQVRQGVWHAAVSGAGDQAPDLKVMHLGQEVPGLSATFDTDESMWHLTLPIPKDLVTDGVQTFVIQDDAQHTLSSFSLIIGEPAAENLQTEIALLRNELEVLKMAFRRHCAES